MTSQWKHSLADLEVKSLIVVQKSELLVRTKKLIENNIIVLVGAKSQKRFYQFDDSLKVFAWSYDVIIIVPVTLQLCNDFEYFDNLDFGRAILFLI